MGIKVGIGIDKRRRRIRAPADLYLASLAVTPDATWRGLYAALINGLIADGDWSALDWVVPLASHDYAGGVSHAGRLNMRNPAKLLTAVNAPVFSALGVTGDGTASHLTTGEAANASGYVYGQNTAHIGAWCNLQGAQAATVPHVGNANASSRMTLRPGTNTAAHRLNDATSLTYDEGGSRTGGRILVRPSSTSRIYYKDGIAVANDATASQIPQGEAVCILRNGGAYCADRLSFFICGRTLSAAAVARVHARVTTYLTAIGAN